MMLQTTISIEVKRGDLFWIDLGNEGRGCEQRGKRPCVVIQNNIGNRHSPCIIVGVITSKLDKTKLPTHVGIQGFGLPKNSVVLLEQIKTLDKTRLGEKIGRVDQETLKKIDNAILISMGLSTNNTTKKIEKNESEYDERKVKLMERHINKLKNLEDYTTDPKKKKMYSINVNIFSIMTKAYCTLFGKENRCLLGAM